MTMLLHFSGEVRVAHVFSFLCCPIMCPVISVKNDIQFVFTNGCLWEGSCLIYVICAGLPIVMSNTYCVVL